ncbi:MAG: glycosyltransferase family 2 protein [Actinobacteria bacterium]|nr:glycosyltransferase family 2 protein [Actinomycetota bacterium]
MLLKNPLFTIAIPVFNRLNYFKEALKSVLNQSFNDFELVIVDDCSTDGTWEYIRAINDPRVKIFRNKSNVGIVPNWRHCIERAQGTWFKFLMSDDLMFPDSLFILDKLIKKYPDNYVFVTSGIGFTDISEIREYLNMENREINGTDKYLMPMEKIIEERKRFNQTWAMPNSYTLLTNDLKKLMRSENYKNVEKNLGKTGHCVDYFILYSIALKYKTMLEMDVPLYGVRYHESNLSKMYSQNLLYHLNGDKYIHYMLYDYKGIGQLYIVRHAFRVYFHKIRSSKREILTFAFVKKAFQLIIFLFQHLFGINNKPRF